MDAQYLLGLRGGLIIGTAAALFLLVNGRIMGASGLLGSVLDGSARGNDRREKLAFIAGLIGAPALVALVFGAPPTHLTGNIAVIIAAGLLVGIGTRIANGCTSGHGVCGISRLSLRGLVATMFYLLAGGVSMVLFRHSLGLI
ncbi:YeeE/YedE family protein [Rhodophyticola sp. CCM32]|uniref:YeeE/YedE family protein n=1 Tax=Rhodophyticola sp. CCM32 TaxID=2916397 RepID=UPI00107F8CBA|nr:YeeE/YedE thiosulfate transporter family protein [Rhodophyticola sp. CCM32]QBY00055.1 YeeE/YedE family protein [Rhodophyticola sp. CCM32]